jgi:phospholipase C
VLVGSTLPTPIEHVVVIIQENRTPDYLFQGVPGADIAQYAIDSHGKRVPLRPVTLGLKHGLEHSHDAFVTDYDNGKMDGFDKNLHFSVRLRPFAYAPESEVKPYHEMAKQYVFADHMFQSNQGPSLPAHLYLISGTATDRALDQYRLSDNSFNNKTQETQAGGCDAKPDILVPTIDLRSGRAGPSVFDCLDRTVMTDLLDRQSVSWRYYQWAKGPGFWHPFDEIKNVRYSPQYRNVITPPQQILTDVANGDLAGVTWVAPRDDWSDHSGRHATTEGPAWVAAVVNAIGKSRFWQSTAIFVLWDDWGGWYDHVPPPIYNAYELGFRVPLVVISPYAKKSYVSKVQHEFGSILAFTEETYGIPKGALGSTDERADDLRDAFDFTQHPRAFVKINAPPFNPGESAPTNDEDP